MSWYESNLLYLVFWFIVKTSYCVVITNVIRLKGEYCRHYRDFRLFSPDKQVSSRKYRIRFIIVHLVLGSNITDFSEVWNIRLSH